MGNNLAQECEPLATRSIDWIDCPVTLPPGRAKLVTRPPRTGSGAIAKTMGITAVACFRVGAAIAFVTITSTLRRMNSAAISAMRSGCPSFQRYSIATVRPSIQPSSRSRWTKAAVQGLQVVAFAPRNPIIGSLVCCARAGSGHVAVAPPINEIAPSHCLTRGLRALVRN
jgi:hypothetical protein